MPGHVCELQALADSTWKRVQLSLETIERSRALLQRAHPCGPRDVNGVPPVRRRMWRMVERVATRELLETIAEAYETTIESVRRDAYVLVAWNAPLDDFVAHLRRSHGWDVGTASVYVGALRSAERHAASGCPWLDET